MAKRKKKLLFGIIEYTGSIGKKKEEPKEVEVPRPPSTKEMEVRLKFALATRFLSKANNLIKIGYYNRTRKGENSSETNVALRYTLKEAIKGEFPNFSVDYPKFFLTYERLRGGIQVGWNINMLAHGENLISIIWQKNDFPNKASRLSDQLMIFLYCEKTDQGIILERAAKRDDMKFSLQMKPESSGHNWHIWYFFMSENERLISVSEYLGEISVMG